jgi:hypothetical protein
LFSRVLKIHPGDGDGSSLEGDGRIDYLNPVHARLVDQDNTRGGGFWPSIRASMQSAKLEGSKYLHFRKRESHL